MKYTIKIIKLVVILLILWMYTSVPAVSQSPAENKDKREENKWQEVYKEAKRLMHKKEWLKAIEQFKLVVKSLPDSSLVDDSLYWQAYSLNRMSRDLENVDKFLDVQSSALEQLEILMKEFPDSRFLDDARILKMEIAEELVKKGFKEYKRYIENGAAKEDNNEMKLIALDALLNMDKKKAFPILEKVIFTNKSAKLRAKALFVLSQTNDARVVPILVKVAQKDKESKVREKAIFWLGQTNNKTALKALTELLSYFGNTKYDIRLKKKIIFSISQLESQEAIKTLIRFYKKEKDISIKKKILFWLGQSKSKVASEFIQSILFD
jgi:outer membrane protein assembly factor BamD (BamD/ComL family)